MKGKECPICHQKIWSNFWGTGEEIWVWCPYCEGNFKVKKVDDKIIVVKIKTEI